MYLESVKTVKYDIRINDARIDEKAGKCTDEKLSTKYVNGVDEKNARMEEIQKERLRTLRRACEGQEGGRKHSDMKKVDRFSLGEFAVGLFTSYKFSPF